MSALFMFELATRKAINRRVEFIQNIVKLYQDNLPDLELDHVTIPESWDTEQFRDKVKVNIFHPQLLTTHIQVVFRGKLGSTHSASYPIPSELKGSDE